MPAILGPLVGFALGVLLAWLARHRDDPRPGSSRTRIVALFAALVFAPVCAYFVIFSADWALSYVIDGRLVPSAVALCLVVLDAVLVVVGFLVGASALRRGAVRTVAALGIAPSVLALAILVAFYPRLRVEGTYHQVKSDFGTQPVAGGPLGYAILWMDGLLVLGVVLTARALTTTVRPPRAQEPSPGGGRSPLLGQRPPRRFTG